MGSTTALLTRHAPQAVVARSPGILFLRYDNLASSACTYFGKRGARFRTLVPGKLTFGSELAASVCHRVERSDSESG